MLDDLNHSSFFHESLTNSDRIEIIASAKMLPGKWITDFEETPDGNDYAILLPPWSDGLTSAFLFERRHNHIVLTDRLSASTLDLISDHDSVCEAMQTVWEAVLGTGSRSSDERP